MIRTIEAERIDADTGATAEHIRFRDVHMVFVDRFRKPVHALRGLDLTVQQGSVVGLLGPNGSGKTTSISCMLGLLEHQHGRIFLWGEPVETIPRARRDRICGVLLEDTRLPPFMRVEMVLRYLCSLRGISQPDREREFERVVAMTRIADLLKRRVSVLSKGQARRVGLAAALVGDPPLLILDEPSAGLDVTAREDFNELVRKLRDGRRTMIIASHLLSDIESTCSHIAIMREGRIILYQKAESLLNEARSRNSARDIYVGEQHAETLDRLGIPHQEAKYPGLRLLRIDGPEHEAILKLAQERIVPERIEPRVSLVSLYIDHIQEADPS